MSDSFGSLAWMHIVELEPVEMAHGNEIIHRDLTTELTLKIS